MGFCPRNTFRQLKHTYTEDLSIITFNYLRENSPNQLYHFRNHKSFFTTQLLYMFLAQTLNTFYKSSIKVKILRLSTALNFTKFLMSFFKQSKFSKVSFSSKFRSFFSVMRDNYSVLFRLKLYMLLAKVAHQSANFQTCHCSH